MNPSATSKITKDQLWQENDYLKSIFMTMDEGLIITDSSGIIQKTNTAMTEMWGYTEAELVGMHTMFLSAETYTLDENPASIERLHTEGENKNVLRRYKKKDGSVFYAELNMRLLQNAGGELIGAIGVFRDITKRKNAEEALLQSEDSYRRLTETAADAIITANGQGYILAWNHGAEKIYGFKAEEIIGRDCVLIMPENQREQHTKIFTMLIKAGNPLVSDLPAEGLGRRKDGSVFAIEQTFNLHWFKNEPFFTIIVRDISRRKEIEKKLQESEELFRLSFENAPIGICIFDNNGGMIQANIFCETCFGRSRDDLMRQGLAMLMDTDDRDNLAQMFGSDHERFRQLTVVENRYFAADGHTIYTKQYIQGVFDTTENLSFIIVLTEDITVEKQLALMNTSIIQKLKDIYGQLTEFSNIAAEDRDFLEVKSLSDYDLSAMETRIISLIYNGYSNKKIAQHLCIAENTVKHHITSIYSKFKVKNRIGLIQSIRTNRIII